METSNVVTFQLSKRKKTGLYITLFLSLFVGIGLLLLSTSFTFGTGRLAVGLTGLVFLYICAFCIYCIYQLLKVDFNGIIISDQGITDLSTGYRIGTILWQDIEKVKVMKDLSSLKYEYVVLIVKNPNEYISREPTRLKKRTLTLKLHYYGSPVCISNRALACSFETLKTIIQAKYEKYKEKQSTNTESN